MSNILIYSFNVRSILKFIRFRELYNMFQVNKINILLTQKFLLSNEISHFFESNFLLVSIIFNRRDDARNEVSIIINNRITKWVETFSETSIVFKDENDRLLICRVKCKTQLLIITNVYVSTTSSQRLKWLKAITRRFDENEIVYHCDVINENFNQTLLKIDRRSRATSASTQVSALNKLLTKLNKKKCDYVNDWRTINSKLMTYTYYKQNVNTFRIDRIYLRSEFMNNVTKWRIQASEIQTDHHAVSMSLNSEQLKNREFDRWRFNSLLLKLQTVQNQINNAISCLLEDDSMNEWMIFKILIKQKLQKRARKFERSTFKFQRRLNQRRERLWKKRRHDWLNRELEIRIKFVKRQKQCLIEWRNHNYSYNAMTKHLLLNEKFTRWFFSRVKQDSYHNIDDLKDEQDIVREFSSELLEIVSRYYEKLYFVKSSNKRARKSILNAISNKISTSEQNFITFKMNAKDIETFCRRIVLKKFLDDDELITKLFKRFTKRSRKTKKNFHSFFTVFIQRLFVMYNQILSEKRLSKRWTNEILTLLFKKKNDKNDLKNYRFIIIMNVNYKIFTEILMQRFVKAFDSVIEEHQSIFLFEKFIDDNIRTIQRIIAKHKDAQQKVVIVFFDQKKIYDRVSHEFLWTALKKLEIFVRFIFWVKLLYADVKIKIYINDHQSEELQVKCEIRQDDFLNCSFFVVVIETLVCCIIKNSRIFEVMTKFSNIKFIMYVDDTAIILKTQNEVDAFIQVLIKYCKTTSAKINWKKSYLLLIENMTSVMIFDIQLVFSNKSYEHLKILVEVNITQQTKNYWKKILVKFHNIVDQWSRFHLSMKSRVLIANNLMLFISRYVINFIELTSTTRQKFEKKYFRLMWDDKKAGVIKNLHVCMSNIDEKINCLDLDSVVNVSIVKIIARAFTRSQLFWIKILNEFVIREVEINESLTKLIDKSWLQWLTKTVKLSSKFRYIWTRWKRLYSSKHTNKVVWLKFSKTHNDVMNIYIWYHSIIEIASNENAKRWDSNIWALLWNSRVRIIANIWNSVKKYFIIFSTCNVRQTNAMKSIIRNLMIKLLNKWKMLITSKFNDDVIDYSRSEYYVRLWKKKENKFTSLTQFDYIKTYKTLIRQKIEDVDFFARIQKFIEVFHRVSSDKLNSNQLWQIAKTQFDISKVENLLWRFLHQKVKVEVNWEWLKKSQRSCLIHEILFTLHHIWIKCNVTKTIWQKMKEIWEYLDIFKIVISNTIFELIVFMTVCFITTKKVIARRWKITYQIAVWAIWKTYLSHFFALSHAYWNANVVVAYYLELLRNRILNDRILCMKERHRNNQYNAKKFKKLWEQYSNQIRIVVDSQCLFKSKIVNAIDAMNIDASSFTIEEKNDFIDVDFMNVNDWAFRSSSLASIKNFLIILILNNYDEQTMNSN